MSSLIIVRSSSPQTDESFRSLLQQLSVEFDVTVSVWFRYFTYWWAVVILASPSPSSAKVSNQNEIANINEQDAVECQWDGHDWVDVLFLQFCVLNLCEEEMSKLCRLICCPLHLFKKKKGLKSNLWAPSYICMVCCIGSRCTFVPGYKPHSLASLLFGRVAALLL